MLDICNRCRHNGRDDICISCVAPHDGSTAPSCFEYYVEDEDVLVNNPAHYQTVSGLEAIDVIESFTAELKGYKAVETGNVLKYMLRWNKKNGLQDLKKARWYLNRLINKLEEEGEL